jgi:predicted DNA-binding transcriptional regulator AlpA
MTSTLITNMGSINKHREVARWSDAGNDDTWIVTFELAVDRAESVPEDALLDSLASHDPVTTTVDDRFVITFSVLGNIQTAIPRAVETLWSALEECGLENATIVKATQISHEQFDTQEVLDLPIQLLCATECARMLEVSKQRISQLIEAGSFPKPDGEVGGRPAWLASTIRTFASNRRAKKSSARAHKNAATRAGTQRRTTR